jgi:hypothetical protein
MPGNLGAMEKDNNVYDSIIKKYGDDIYSCQDVLLAKPLTPFSLYGLYTDNTRFLTYKSTIQKFMEDSKNNNRYTYWTMTDLQQAYHYCTNIKKFHWGLVYDLHKTIDNNPLVKWLAPLYVVQFFRKTMYKHAEIANTFSHMEQEMSKLIAKRPEEDERLLGN